MTSTYVRNKKVFYISVLLFHGIKVRGYQVKNQNFSNVRVLQFLKRDKCPDLGGKGLSSKQKIHKQNAKTYTKSTTGIRKTCLFIDDRIEIIGSTTPLIRA